MSKSSPAPEPEYNEMGIDISRRNAEPRPLTDAERERLEEFIDSIHYSSR